MSQVTRVNVPLTLGAADRLDVWAGKLEAALAALQRETSEMHGCWGDDKFGVKFAQGYLPAAEKTLASAGVTAESLQSIATNLRTIVRLFQELDNTGSRILELDD